MIRITLLLLSLVLVINTTQAIADSTLPRSPASVRQEKAEGEAYSAEWNDVANVMASDDRYATVSLNESGYGKEVSSHLLCVTGFGFRIPEGATIQGIEARIEKIAESISIRDLSLRLIKRGIITGALKVNSGKGWPVIADGIRTHGGPSELWGLDYPGYGLTVADVNASDFGMAISAFNLDSTELQREAAIDQISMVVYFRLPIVPKQMGGFDQEVDLLATLRSGGWCYRQTRAPSL